MPDHINTTDPAFETFGDLLKYLRRRARLTQNQLAGAVGYTREHLARLETDARPPDVTVVRAQFISGLGLQSEPVWAERLIALAQVAHAARVDVRTPPAAHPITQTTHTTPNPHLPTPLTSFIGRERVVAEVTQLLSDARLVTLIGSGGVGKTRLALQVAVRLQSVFAEGVSFVELAPVQDMAFVPSAVAAALQLPATKPPLESLIEHLREQHGLLILDNCEHVLLACAELASKLLQACPRLTILATSRESFGMLGATVYRVPSLALPSELAHEETAAAIIQTESVQLFIERARALKPTFAITERTAPIVGRICRRLDGVPLAIELAASRVRALSVEQIAERLDDRFNLLTSGNTTALPRHQTLRAAMDWSHALLTKDEQCLFRRLSIFVGGWTLEAAEAIADFRFWILDSPPAPSEPIQNLKSKIQNDLDVLTSLVDKSLVVVDEREDETRYHMLESVRDYALSKLHAAGEIAQAHAAHLHVYTVLAEQADPQLRRADQRRWYQRLEAEHDNLRAALNWAAGLRDAAATTRLVAALWFFWFWRGYWVEGVARTQSALAMPHEAHSLIAAKLALAALVFASRSGNNAVFNAVLPKVKAAAQGLTDPYVLAWVQIAFSFASPDHDEAAHLLEAAASNAQRADDHWLMAEALFIHGDRERARGQHERAKHLYQRSIALLRAINDYSLIAYPIGNLGRLAVAHGDDAEALARFEEAVALCREDGNKLGLADWLLQLGTLTARRGDVERARVTLAEGIQRFQEIGNIEGVADALVQYAALAQRANDLARATTLLGAADCILETHNRLHQLVEMTGSAEFKQRTAEVRSALESDAFSSAWAAGRAMTTAQAIGFALRNRASLRGEH